MNYQRNDNFVKDRRVEPAGFFHDDDLCTYTFEALKHKNKNKDEVSIEITKVGTSRALFLFMRVIC